MKRTIILILPLAILILVACTEDSPVSPESDLVVVRGYIYAGEPVNDIQLTNTLPLGSEETKAPPINDANVALMKNGQQYDLVLSEGDSGYYKYEGTDLTVKAGDQFTIQVSYQDQHISGTTNVPEAPKNITISSTTLLFPDMETMWQLMQQGVNIDSIRKSMTLTVSWEQASDALYYVLVENVEENPVAIETNFGPGPGFGAGPNRFISQPIAASEYTVNAMIMTHLGKHRVKVYRVNQEYADLYQSRNQDSRDLNEPLTNIVNGLGVFSAFNSDSAFFNLQQ